MNSVFKYWIVFILVLADLIFILDLLPQMISEPQTEVVFLGVILTGVVVTINYYAIRALFFRKKKNEENKGDKNEQQ